MPADHKTYIGRRIEIPVHYNMWARGARHGLVTRYRNAKVPGTSDYLLVKMDHPQIKRRLKLWRLDWEYCRVLDDNGNLDRAVPGQSLYG